MRNNWFLLLLIAYLNISCSSDDDPLMLAPSMTLNDASEITRISAVISGNIQPVGNGIVKEGGLVYSTNPDLSDGYFVEVGLSAQFSVTLSDLIPETTYYYALYASSGFTNLTSKTYSFKTLDIWTPTLGEIEILSVSKQSIILSCAIIDTGGVGINNAVFYYKLSDGSENWMQSSAIVSGNMAYAEISGLESGQEYIVYAYVRNDEGGTETSIISVTTNEEEHLYDSEIRDMDDSGSL